VADAAADSVTVSTAATSAAAGLAAAGADEPPKNFFLIASIA